ncbi:phosphatidylinositol mannoside acyltransferase [Streptoalloteichus tenebrarius]|uniref:phosphatidylinositol mannoside acyltransferase n=1 Tax=Streptoalloteichus tenebrarius (strain ATCC 17920 / DSM 40477 / JCM 4838 / CBS 697.72 / NBRC 16177 / NCIMB 11028 / NRRL B-12390 / A12253. 1 / ISP 5477) TaxID=1933 RepID=UPI0020A58EDC|nr:phosphatidylinositol mannoside acyltransferase [Streptoalloteichus tenebrarius]
MTNWRERLVDSAYALGWRMVGTVPPEPTLRLFQAAGGAAARLGTPGARRLRRNLSRVRPTATSAELDELTREAMRSCARYWWEVFELPHTDLRRLREVVDPHVTGRDNLDIALARGRGVVLALPHSGNWDVAGVWLVGCLGRFTTVMERPRPESLYRRFADYRRALGFEVVPLTGDATSAASVLAERLRANRAVCLLADRLLAGDGVAVSFFGEPAFLPAGPARLAAATGAALLPVGSWFTDDGGWAVRFHRPIPVAGREDVAPATQALADTFAADIGRRPQDWHLLRPLWEADLGHVPVHVPAPAPTHVGHGRTWPP